MTKTDIKKLDKLFSLYIRQLYSKDNQCECYTCGRYFETSKIQCGHFWSRKHYSVRWDENNARPQCYGCNVMQYGRQYEFGLKLETEIGSEKFNQLAIRKTKTSKDVNLDAKQLIEYFNTKLKQLTNDL